MINYDDEQLQKVEAEKQAAINENNQMYDGMIAESDKYYQDQIDATKEWTDKQTELQNEQTDFALEQIEQQKKETEKDYIKEQKGAYVDWQKQSNKYGANAERMAAQGMANSGYAESSQVAMYNTYQNRVATARESWERAKLNYENAMTEARLQNNAALAEIAYQGLQQELELSLQGFQYKNELLMAKENAKAQILGRADTQYQAVLEQMNRENELKESIRQYQASQNAGISLTPDDESVDTGISGDGGTGSPVATEIRVNSVLDASQLSLMNEALKAAGVQLSGSERIYSYKGKYYIRKGQDDYIEVPTELVMPSGQVYIKKLQSDKEIGTVESSIPAGYRKHWLYDVYVPNWNSMGGMVMGRAK